MFATFLTDKRLYYGKKYKETMKKSILLLFLIFAVLSGFSQSTKSGQTSNHKKKRPAVQRTPPKNWSKKKQTNPIRSKFANEVIAWDAGITAGAANSLTDIFGNAEQSRGFIMDMQMSQTNLAAGGYLRYKFNQMMGANLSVNYLKLQGADSISKITRTRNYSFTNNVIEIAAKMEFYRPQPVSLFKRPNTTTFDFYGYTGLAGFYHKPEFYTNMPEGEVSSTVQYDPNDYSKFQFGIPFGIGFYFTFSNKIRLGGEGYWMKTFTDYLDGYSTPAGDRNDNYLAAKISLGYIFLKGTKNRKSW